jgi:hypothetical protein
VLDAGVVHQDVDGPEHVAGVGHHLGDGRRLRQVGAGIDHLHVMLGGEAVAGAQDRLRVAPKPFSTTAAPSAARASATPSPMPLVEPVIRAVRPASGRPGRGGAMVVWAVMCMSRLLGAGLGGRDQAAWRSRRRR